MKKLPWACENGSCCDKLVKEIKHIGIQMAFGRPDNPLEYAPNGDLYQGSAIRQRRQQKGLSLAELSALAGYQDSGGLSNVENNRARASREKLKKIATVLDLDGDELGRLPLHPRLLKRRKEALEKAEALRLESLSLDEITESARSLEKESRYREATERYDEAYSRAIRENVGNDQLARLYMAAIWPNYVLSKHEKCLELANNVINLSENGEASSSILGDVYEWLAMIYLDFGELKRAQQYANKGLELIENPTTLYVSLGNIYTWLGEWRQAARLFKCALALCSQAEENKNQWGLILNNVAMLYALQGRLFEATDLALQSLRLRVGTPDSPETEYTRGVAYSNSSLSVINIEIGQLDTAEVYAINAIEHFSKIGDARNVAFQYYDLALIALKRGNPEVAREYANVFVKHFQNSNFKSAVATGQRLMGMIHAALNIDTEAEGLLVKSVEGFRSTEEQYELALSCYELGRIKQKLGEETEAMAHLREARSIFQNLYVPGQNGVERKVVMVDEALASLLSAQPQLPVRYGIEML